MIALPAHLKYSRYPMIISFTLQCDSILLVEPLFGVVNGFLECPALHSRVLLQEWGLSLEGLGVEKVRSP